MLFSLGTVVATDEISVACQDSSFASGVRNALNRHMKGDWGNVCDSDKALNNQALTDETRLLSSYEVNGQKVWIITEADRSSTTVLFPHEY